MTGVHVLRKAKIDGKWVWAGHWLRWCDAMPSHVDAEDSARLAERVRSGQQNAQRQTVRRAVTR